MCLRLPNPKRSAAAWLRKHTVDCVVWVTEKAKDCQGNSESVENDEDDSGSEDEEGILQDKEKEEHRCLMLASSLIEETTCSSVMMVPQDNIKGFRAPIISIQLTADSLNTYSKKNRESEPCKKI